MDKKIIVIGSPGSGKSYFTRQLHEITNIPIYYLDCIFWKEGWVHITREELQAKVSEIMKNDEWIIDGNYQSSLEDRFKEAQTIFFLDIDEEICIASEKERRGKKRDDLPSFLVEEEDPEFVEYIKNFKNDGKLIIQDLINKYSEKEIIIFKTREEKEIYIKNLKIK